MANHQLSCENIRKDSSCKVCVVSAEGSETVSIPVESVKLSGAMSKDRSLKDQYVLRTSQERRIDSHILSKVAEFLTHYSTVEEMQYFDPPFSSIKIENIVEPSWYADFALGITSRDELYDLIAAADALDIKPLLRLAILAVSCGIEDLTETRLREVFNNSMSIYEEH